MDITKDTCLKDIGLDVHNMLTILDTLLIYQKFLGDMWMHSHYFNVMPIRDDGQNHFFVLFLC